MKVCNLSDIKCLQAHSSKIKMLAFSPESLADVWDEYGLEECDCPSGGI